MHHITAFISGLLFGLGLCVSGMTQPGKVVAFLDFTGNWDPSLAFVMGAALLVFAPAYRLISNNRERPLFSLKFDLPTNRDITPRLVVGAAIFGVGWGVGGFCPGTAVTTLPTLGPPVLTLVGGVLLGILGTWGAQSALSHQDVPVNADF